MADFEDAWRAEQAVFFEQGLVFGGVGGHVYGEEALLIHLAFHRVGIESVHLHLDAGHAPIGIKIQNHGAAWVLCQGFIHSGL